MASSLLILGVGNLLRTDDGVGIHAVRELALRPPDGTQVVDAGTDFLSAIPFLEAADRVLMLDAVHGRGDPGTRYELAADDLVPRPDGGPAHMTSVIESRRLLSPDAVWPEITVLGVEPLCLDYGITLSTPVARALPRLVARAREIIISWQIPYSLTATPQVAS